MKTTISHGVYSQKTGELVQGGLTSDEAFVLATSLTVATGSDYYVAKPEKTTTGESRKIVQVTKEDRIKALELKDQFLCDLPSLTAMQGVHDELLFVPRLGMS